jgi:hypothetical protein
MHRFLFGRVVSVLYAVSDVYPGKIGVSLPPSALFVPRCEVLKVKYSKVMLSVTGQVKANGLQYSTCLYPITQLKPQKH